MEEIYIGILKIFNSVSQTELEVFWFLRGDHKASLVSHICSQVKVFIPLQLIDEVNVMCDIRSFHF